MRGSFRRLDVWVVVLGAALIVVVIGAALMLSRGGNGQATTAAAGSPVVVDGVTWTPYDVKSDVHVSSLSSAVPVASGYVGLCESQALCWSADGVTWTLSQAPELQRFEGGELVLWSIVRGRDGVLMNGFRHSPSKPDVLQPEIYRSSDGFGWALVSTVGPDYRMVGGAAGFVGQYSAGSARGDVLVWSADGVTWTPSDFRTGGEVIELWATSTAYFAVERQSGDRLWRSTDGRHWTLSPLGGVPCRGLAEAPNGTLVIMYLGPPSGCTLALSRDGGLTWESANLSSSIPEFNRPMRIGNGLFTEAGFDVLGSTDGVNWRSVTPPGLSDRVMDLISLGDEMLVTTLDSQMWIGRPA